MIYNEAILLHYKQKIPILHRRRRTCVPEIESAWTAETYLNLKLFDRQIHNCYCRINQIQQRLNNEHTITLGQTSFSQATEQGLRSLDRFSAIFPPTNAPWNQSVYAEQIWEAWADMFAYGTAYTQIRGPNAPQENLDAPSTDHDSGSVRESEAQQISPPSTTGFTLAQLQAARELLTRNEIS